MALVPGRVALALLAVVALLACGATVAQAHDGRPVVAPAPAPVAAPAPVDVAANHAISAAPAAPIAPVVFLVALGIAATLVLVAAPRRVVALAVVPLIVFVIFETGVHGVHHLGDPRAAGQCSVAVTAEHVTGASSDVPTDVAPLVLVSAPVALPDSPIEAGQDHRPADGRAPPAPSA